MKEKNILKVTVNLFLNMDITKKNNVLIFFKKKDTIILKFIDLNNINRVTLGQNT